MSPPTDPDLESLADLEPGIPPQVPGSTDAPAGPTAPPDLSGVVPLKKPAKSGAQRRREARERAGLPARKPGRPRKGTGPAAAAKSAGPKVATAIPAEKPAAKVDAAALEQARRTIEDPETLDFIESLYRMPFSAWAQAVDVAAVVPSPPKVKRAAKLIRQCMALWGPKAWMRYLPIVFLALAIGEDVVAGAAAVGKVRRQQRQGGNGQRPAPGQDESSPAGTGSGPPKGPPA